MLFRYSNIIIFINSFFRPSWWRWPWMESRISWYQWRRERGQLFRYLKNFAQLFSLPITWVLSKPWMRKVFLFVHIESWNFQHLFDEELCETSQNFNSFGQFLVPIKKCHLNIVWMSCNFMRFHEILNQRNAKNFSFLYGQTKKFCFLKNIWAKPSL